LQLTRSKGLGEAANDERLEFRTTVELGEIGVVSALMVGQIGEPSKPDTSSVLLDLWHDAGVAGKLRKMELSQEVISLGRGAIAKPAGI
jgi:hypothetical protein